MIRLRYDRSILKMAGVDINEVGDSLWPCIGCGSPNLNYFSRKYMWLNVLCWCQTPDTPSAWGVNVKLFSFEEDVLMEFTVSIKDYAFVW